MLDVTSLRSGTVFEDNGAPWIVLKYEHVKMGRGTATIKVKIRNLKSGTTIEKSFINGARVPEIILEEKKGQYLYKDGSGLVFMDTETYDQFSVPEDLVGDSVRFLKEGVEVDLKFYEGQPLSIALPLKLKFKIIETEPGYKGNSVTNIYKDAVIETGAKVKVPLFVEEDEEIVVNTDTGEYVERAK